MRGNQLYKTLDRYFGIVILLIFRIFKGRRKTTNFPNHISNILIIKLAALGDTIVLIPSIKAIKKKYPASTITMVGTEINRDFIQLFPEYVNEFIAVDVKKIISQPKYFFSLVKNLRRKEFDIAVDFEQWSNISSVIAGACRTSFLVGFKKPSRFQNILYSETVTRDHRKHEAENFLTLASRVHVLPAPIQLEVKINHSNVAQIKARLISDGWNGSDTLILIHPGCGSHGFPREWSVELYQQLMEELGINKIWFVVTGSAAESSLVNYLHTNLQNRSSVFINADLFDLIALISLCKLAVSGNNGIMHLIAAVGIPQVALHGPTDSVKWGPINSKAKIIKTKCPECPCLDLGFEYHRIDGYCMKQISYVEVKNAYQELLSSN